MKHFILIALAGLALPVSCQIATAAQHEREWQTGALLDTQGSRVYLGTFGGSTVHYGINEVEVIDVGKCVYYVGRVLKWRWNKTANLTVNAPVQFAIQGQTMYLLDESGRQHKTLIIKKVLKR